MRIGLGTVQFGLDYGVSNAAGKTPIAEVRTVLDYAAGHGIGILDTAPAYGNSEDSLGQVRACDRFQVVTKTPVLNKQRITPADAEAVAAAFSHSLQRLRTNRIYGWIVHNSNDLLVDGGEYVYECLVQARNNGEAEKIGASVYDAQQLDGLLRRYILDIVQLPLNVLDQRLVRSGHLAELQARGIEIHVRSVFLQGLLLMPLDSVPAYFAPMHTHLRRYHEWVAREQLTPLQAALQFMRSVVPNETLICGINTCEQLREICDALRSGDLLEADWQAFALDDPTMVNPSLWKL